MKCSQLKIRDGLNFGLYNRIRNYTKAICDSDLYCSIDNVSIYEDNPHWRNIADVFYEFKVSADNGCFHGCLKILDEHLPQCIKSFLNDTHDLSNPNLRENIRYFHGLGNFYRYIYLCEDIDFFRCFTEYLSYYNFTYAHFNKYTMNNILSSGYFRLDRGHNRYRFIEERSLDSFGIGSDGLVYIAICDLEPKILQYLLDKFSYSLPAINKAIEFMVYFNRHKHLAIILEKYDYYCKHCHHLQQIQKDLCLLGNTRSSVMLKTYIKNRGVLEDIFDV